MKTGIEARIMIVVIIIIASSATAVLSLGSNETTSVKKNEQLVAQPTTTVDTNERALDLKNRGPELNKAIYWGYSTPLDGEQKQVNGFNLKHFVAQNIFLGETIVYKKENPKNPVYIEGSDEISVWLNDTRLDIRPGSFKIISHPVTELTFVALYKYGYLKVGELEIKEETNE